MRQTLSMPGSFSGIFWIRAVSAIEMNLSNRFKALANRLLSRASFARNVGVLAGGIAAAQAIGIVALPLVTRLYAPPDFSVLAVYSSILGIAAGVACVRLDIAIPLSKSDGDAANLLASTKGVRN